MSWEVRLRIFQSCITLTTRNTEFEKKTKYQKKSPICVREKIVKNQISIVDHFKHAFDIPLTPNVIVITGKLDASALQ